MGTRHLICVVADGQFKVAQYGQWDGYPEGQGVRILKFLRGCDLQAFRSRALELTETTQEEWDEMWASIGVKDADDIDYLQGKEFTQKYPWQSRDCGANILGHVMNGDCRSVRLNVEFAEDSLFCEWAYVIDLDANALEVYTDRLSFAEEGKHHLPLPLVGRWNLSEIPSDVEFVDALTEKEDA